MYFLEKNSSIDLSEYILIFPAVSVGNVGQLAVDLLITTLKLTKIGYIRHPNILPVAAHVNGSHGITTECEVYASAHLKIAVVQIRSTYGRFASISKYLSELCKSVKGIVILTGSYAYERKNIHLVAEPIRYLATEPLKKSKFPSIPQHWEEFEIPKDSAQRLRIPGSGIADHLFQQCVDEDIPAALIVIFVSEGDNRIDAVNLVNYMDSWLEMRKTMQTSLTSWQFPAVWETLNGNSFPTELF